ncbi:MAG TPA: ATP-dependent helicase C-terminal domain-containing protein, partial [Bryobacteraceae bacterium]|nr:ATP-dependent helicase C-terminal domain-containing protein [Bryobacteraceae bacterium]
GRAGRTGPGRAIRLYPLEDFARRPHHDAPEITRADLAPGALLLEALGVDGFGALEWLDAPPPEHVEHARDLLRQLGAHGREGREMARYPLHPRLARLILEARRRGVAEDGCTVAALLSAGERLPAAPQHALRSDLLALLEARWEPRTAQIVRQVRRIVNPPRQKQRDEEALLISVLAAFPDRVARRRQAAELQMASGGPAQLAASSSVTAAEFLVAVEAEDRRDHKAPLVRLASAIEPEWLLDLFPERIRETSRVEWNRSAERIEAVSALLFDAIPIEERRGEADPEAAAALLGQKALEAGVARFADSEELAAFLARTAFAAAHADVPRLGPPELEAALRSLSFGLKSFAELESAARHGGLLRALEQQLPPGARRLLDEVAPERVRLPGGRQVKVHYEENQPPWIASRLQDFFGLRDTPTVARGAVPVVVRLLAPNQRPVQMTTDLGGFWQRLYPQLRRELSRRYPKHAWPEDPLG